MKFEIIKDTKLNGKSYYKVYTEHYESGREFHELFTDEKEATDFMAMLMNNYRSGLPSSEVLLSKTI